MTIFNIIFCKNIHASLHEVNTFKMVSIKNLFGMRKKNAICNEILHEQSKIYI